jgi:hypothetical protein
MSRLSRKTLLILTIVIFSTESFSQSDNGNGRLINVKDHNAVGDGKTDDTKAIQQTISQASEGDTVFIPDGTYLVRALGLKSGVHIKGEGLMVQRVDGDMEEFTPSKQNSTAPLIRGDSIFNVFLSFRAKTVNEAIYFSGSKNITIANSQLEGNPDNIRSFAGVLLYDCENVSITKSAISHYGAKRKHPTIYQPGTAIRILSSKNVSVTHSNIFENGENGVFMHDTPDVEVSHNHIQNNGMSAIQVAFGRNGIEKNYEFINNVMEGNAADAIDINNRSLVKYLDINCQIENNISRNNGYVNGESTPDGSGIATLINISGVEMLNNLAEGNNRPALYIESCGSIYATGNKADNQVEVVLDFDELKLSNNTFSLISLLANVKGKKLLMTNNELQSLSLPNGIHVDSLVLRNNIIANASLNFNMTGNARLKGNVITSKAKDGALLIVRADSFVLERNQIISTSSYAVSIRNMARNVSVINNHIRSVNACIFDFGSEGLHIADNKLTSLEGGGFRHTLISKKPNRLVLSNNEHKTDSKANALRLEGPGTALVLDESILQGYADYGSVEVKKTKD